MNLYSVAAISFCTRLPQSIECGLTQIDEVVFMVGRFIRQYAWWWSTPLPIELTPHNTHFEQIFVCVHQSCSLNLQDIDCAILNVQVINIVCPLEKQCSYKIIIEKPKN
jgi:hypothetical protein